MHQPPSEPTPTSPPNSTPAARPLFDEADIGSGEKTVAQQETEEIIRQIPPLPPSDRAAAGEAARAPVAPAP